MIESADLAWRDGVPFARDFGDIYHSADGAGETQRVFIEPSNLAVRAGRAAADGTTLRVGELGFGTGLNFAVAAALALRQGCRLHYVGLDACPVAPADFRAIAAKRRTRLPAYGELERFYPPMLPGWHRRVLAQGRIWLSLYWGDAQAGLRDLVGRQRQPFDAWFLDGFAPARNPEMWRDELLRLATRFAARGTAVATFTAAGHVRRSLEAAGFEMRRVDQRPRKRESLTGVYTGEGLKRESLPASVTVAGAGIAGASIARHLAERGIAVSVYDPAPAIASGASGIPAMLLHPRLLGDRSRAAAWRAHAYAYSQAWASRFPGFVESGVVQGCGPNLDRGKLQRIAAAHAGSGMVRRLERSEASAVSGWDFDCEALYFPRAGIVEPPTLVRSLFDHPRISVRLGLGASAGTRPLVLACVGAVRDYAPARFLETVDVHGQVDVVTMDARPRLAVVGDGYLAPTGQGVVAGATFEHAAWPDGKATAHNLRGLAGRAHRWVARVRATRTIGSDRTPIVGELEPGVLVSTAHGSMGMVSAPMAGAIIASRLTGDFAPVEPALEEFVSPARFRQRQARRGYRLGAAE
ncbi:MAG: tRNA (5-methylaminomethyl-2-thiouridine)(34)-methyltransferase MnmD [Rhodospirillaceae bacterium]|nr:tRNA (5-methylaminomethyl-2-thiouridine)(34)-methyltransferase MnmD [Rhodospirillaceae bacterium]